MISPMVWRVAQNIADERAQQPQPYEGYVTRRERHFTFPRQLLLQFASVLINTGTKLQVRFAH